MTQLIAKTVQNMTNEEFVKFSNAALDQLHDEASFDLGDPCMLNICGLDYTPTEVKPFEEDVEEASVFNVEIKKYDDFQLIMMMQHCPSSEIIPFIATRQFVQTYIIENVLPMLIDKTPIILWKQEE